jgi:hypothetical protein
MLRKLLLPLAAVAVAGGCATMSDYQYRNGGTGGDYYYGRPGVDYRYQGSPYGYGPYGYGPSVRFGYYGRYGYPHYSHPYYGYYGHPYYGYPYRPPVVVVQPRPDGGEPVIDRDDDDRRAPWRDFNARRRIATPDTGPAMRAPEPARPARPMPSMSDGGGSRMEQLMRRSREDTPRSSEVEP